jgi:transposase
MAKRTFTREFKLEAVKLVKERGVSMSQASRDLDIHLNVLRKWVKDVEADPVQAFPGQGQMKADQAEIAKLRKEVAKLKMERDILKKAAVGSTRRRNCFAQLIGWRSETQGLTGSFVKTLGDFA